MEFNPIVKVTANRTDGPSDTKRYWILEIDIRSDIFSTSIMCSTPYVHSKDQWLKFLEQGGRLEFYQCDRNDAIEIIGGTFVMDMDGDAVTNVEIPTLKMPYAWIKSALAQTIQSAIDGDYYFAT